MKKSPFRLDSIAVNFVAGDPDKRAFVFLHGNSQNSSCGQGVLDFFHQRGHSIFSYDLPGHGDSPLETEDYCFADLIDLNQQMLLEYQIENPVLCGHSLGGMIHSGTITKYQLKNSSLILCGSYDSNPSVIVEKYLTKEKAKQAIKALDDYMNEGFSLFKRQHKYDYFDNRHVEDEIVNIINRRYSNPQASLINLKTLGEFDVREKLIDLEIPVLILHGLKEQVIYPELVKGMVAEYENVRLGWYPDNGHLAFYQQPEMTDEFLSQHYSFLTE